MPARRPISSRDATDAAETDVWHSWLRPERLIRVLLSTSWDSNQWPHAKRLLRAALDARMKQRLLGWFN